MRWAVEKVNIALTTEFIERKRRRQHVGQAGLLDASPMTITPPPLWPTLRMSSTWRRS